MIGAIRQPNGKYVLIDIKFDLPTKNTFSYKEKIKGFGAIWDGEHWTNFPEDKLKEIGASKRFKIRTEPYQNLTGKSEDSYAFEYQIKNNHVLRLDLGDSWVSVGIEENYGEQ
jgi:hypothetical protein